MELAQMLDIRRGVTAIIGSGGKTTLMYALARELSRAARVIVCTTTHIFPPEHMPCLLSPTAEQVAQTLQHAPVVCVGARSESGKLIAPELSFSVLCGLCDYVLVEADGSRRLPIKAHAPYEPVVPEEANQTICVLGLSGLMKPIRESVHRPERYAADLGVDLDAVVTPELAAAHLRLEALHTRVFLNQADTPEDRALGRRLADALSCPVCMGALERGEAACLY